MPAPVPVPSAQRTGRSRRASRARSASSASAAGSASRAARWSRSSRERGFDVVGTAAERRRAVAQLGREVGHVDGDVDADPEHRPAVRRARLDEDPGELAAVEQDVVRPLHERGVAREVGDGEARAQREQRVVVAQQQRAQQRAAGRTGPRSALTATPCGLLRRGDERAVRRAGGRERAGAVVGRPRRAEVQPRAAELLAHAPRSTAGPRRRGRPRPERRERDRLAGPHVERCRGVARVDRHGDELRRVLVDERVAGRGRPRRCGRSSRPPARRRPSRRSDDRSAVRRGRGPRGRRAGRRCRTCRRRPRSRAARRPTAAGPAG